MPAENVCLTITEGLLVEIMYQFLLLSAIFIIWKENVPFNANVYYVRLLAN